MDTMFWSKPVLIMQSFICHEWSVDISLSNLFFLRHWCKCASILSSIYLPFLQTYNCCFCNSIWAIYFEKNFFHEIFSFILAKESLTLNTQFPWLLSYHNLISYTEVWESPTLLAIFSSHISSVCTFHLIKYLFKHF